MHDDASQIPVSLSAAVCTNCGYSLAGLTKKPVCPECGKEHDESEVVLHGWARGRHENLANAKRSRIAVMLLLSFTWVAFSIPSLALTGPRFDFLIGVAGVSISAAILLFRRSDANHPGLIQVRLSDRGCVQYDNLHAPSAIGELFRAHGWAVLMAAAIIVLTLWLARSIDALQFWIWFPLLVVAVPVAWRACRKFRARMREIRDGSIADANSATYTWSAWTDVADFSLKPSGKANHRVRINTFTKLFGNDVVNAEIACTAEQAKSLRVLLDVWIQTGKKLRNAAAFSVPE